MRLVSQDGKFDVPYEIAALSRTGNLAKSRSRWGVQRGFPLALLGNFQRCLQCGSENSLISYGISCL